MIRHFWILVRKEFLHIVRDRLTLWILLGLPILLLMLFGFALSTDVNNISFAVYAPSGDSATRFIVQRFQESAYFKFYSYIYDPRQIQALFKSGKISLVVVFPDSFQDHLLRNGRDSIQLIADGADPNTASTVVQYASQLIFLSGQALTDHSRFNYQIIPDVQLLYNPRLISAYYFVPGVMGMILLLISAMMTSISIVREKERGTMSLLLVSPLNAPVLIFAKLVPYFCIAIVNFSTILVLAVTVLHVPQAGNLALLYFVSIVYILVCLCLGLFISTLVRTQLVALLITGMGFIIPIILLSGMVFPIDNMPLFLQILSHFVPARWYISAVKQVMIKGLGFTSIIQELVILSMMLVFFLLLSLKKFSMRSED